MSTNTKAAEMLEQVNSAISAVLAGGQSYKIGSRSLTRADLAQLKAIRDDLRRRSTVGRTTACWIAPLWRSLTGGNHGSL